MKLLEINIDDLAVNKSNDRHGELSDEDAAIEWLLSHKAGHMRNLAKDIVASGEVFETPLVAKRGKKYVVYDGNRRTATLKLLKAPQRSPTKEWADFYSEQRSSWLGNFPDSVTCQIEDDLDRIDEILYRRHTGQQNGIGQSRWEDEAKTNFQRRTGKNTKINVAESIEQLLQKEGRLQKDERIPRSNMNRLLSAEQFRNRAGIAVDRNSLKLTHEKEAVLDALEKIARDLITGEITLEKIWDNNSKRTYLNQLDQFGILPNAKNLPSNYSVSDNSKTEEKNIQKKTNGNSRSNIDQKRNFLVRNLDIEIQETEGNRRALDILVELQFRLEFGKHDNAIAVLLRVVLELSMQYYAEVHTVQGCGKNATLADKVSKVSHHMLSKAIIDSKYHQLLEKMDNGETLISANTLNAYIHSSDFFVSEKHLIAIWDTLQKFIVLSLSACRK